MLLNRTKLKANRVNKDEASIMNMNYYADVSPKTVEALFNENHFKCIADLGAGDGALLYPLFKQGYLDHIDKVIAVDLDIARLKNIRKTNNKILCLVSDVCKLAIANNINLDLVLCSQVIEHLKYDKDLIQEAHRVLKKNGFLWLTTVYKKWYAWFFYKNKENKRVINPDHIREYREDEELITFIKDSRFQVIKNSKKLFWFPIIDFFLKRMGFRQDIYQKNIFLKILRFVKVPIFGYYCWEILCKKI